MLLLIWNIYGGLGGNTNGTNETAGAGLRITDSDVVMVDYNGLGIYADTASTTNNISLNSITADEVKFSGNNTISLSTSHIQELLWTLLMEVWLLVEPADNIFFQTQES